MSINQIINMYTQKDRVFLPTRNIDDYFTERVKYKIEIYEKLGRVNKWIFISTSAISIICAAIVPILINTDEKHLATILSVVVSVLVGLQELLQPKEHWRNYDKISATLRREEMLFSTGTGVYTKEKLEDNINLFVTRFEDFISREREETITMRTDDNEISLKING